MNQNSAVTKKIRIEDIARKFAELNRRNEPGCLDLGFPGKAHPQVRELVLFVEAMELRPGGWDGLAEKVVAEFPERVGTPTMLAAKGENYSAAEKLAILCELPRECRPEIQLGKDNVRGEILGSVSAEELAKLDTEDLRALESALCAVDAETLRGICRTGAKKRLSMFFASIGDGVQFSLDEGRDAYWRDRDEEDTSQEIAIWSIMRRAGISCLGIAKGSLWCFHDVLGAAVQYMDRHAQKAKSRLAMTAVTKKVFEAIDEAAATGEPAFISGNSRFGKTESLKAKCEMHPGRLRFVAVPPGSSLRALLIRIAEAIGISVSYGTADGPLRAKIEYVLDHSGLVLVFDEGAWLLPENYSQTTQPVRMNFLRSVLMDRGKSCVIAVTPQWYNELLLKYTNKTGYVIEQFTGRMTKVCLPDELDQEDMVKVAAVHFPEFDKRADLLDIGAVAKKSENYLKAIEQLSKHARYVAERDGVHFSMDFVKKTINESFPKPIDVDEIRVEASNNGARINSQESTRTATIPDGIGDDTVPLPEDAPPRFRKGAAGGRRMERGGGNLDDVPKFAAAAC